MQRIASSAGGTRKKRKARNITKFRWPAKTVPYDISNTFSRYDTEQVWSAIRDWQQYTCLNIRPFLNTDSSWVVFQTGQGCQSEVGYHGPGPQIIFLSPLCRRKKQIIIHEIGHAIGFFHEQSRPDRDKFVRIQTENIIAGDDFDFKKWSHVINTFGVPYDYKSIMHYGKDAFSWNGKPTIVTVDPSYQDVIGKASGLSFRDIKLANLMYNCSETCNNPPSCPAPGFIGKDCKCWCPGKPITRCQVSVWTTWTGWTPCTISCGDGGVHTRSRLCRGFGCPSNRNESETKQCSIAPCQGSMTCGQKLTGVTGSFASPNYPDVYPRRAACTWLIQVPSSKIRMYFLTFSLEYCRSCVCDIVYVYDGISENSPILGSFCGGDVPRPLRSTGDSMLVKFVSDEYLEYTGFNATYTADADTSWSPWGRWTSCTASCGTGVQTRSRYCQSRAGATCAGANSNSRNCYEEPCDVTVNISCDFETPCTEIQTEQASDAFYWSKKQCCTPSTGTGPDFDHTFKNKSGHFMYTEASGNSRFLALLQTEPPLRHNHDMVCVHFWYHMRGFHMGTLSVVYLLYQTGKTAVAVWEKTGNQGDAWIEQKLTVHTINKNRAFKIKFEAVVGNGYQSDICIDDVKITSGPCDNYGLTSFSCDFETRCGALQNQNDSVPYVWERKECCTGSRNTGPDNDRTKGTKKGHFIYVEATERQRGSVAILETDPPLKATSSVTCLHFWHHMYGRKMGSLVVLYEEQGLPAKEIWSKTGDQGNFWQEVYHPVNTRSGITFSIQFKATRGSEYTSDIALDDVSLSPGPC